MGMRPINNILDQHIFRQEYNRLAKMSVPPSYVKQCRLFGWYDENNELQGGYAFAQGQDMAWPKLVQGNLNFFQNVKLETCLEFNMAWAKGSLHESCLQMIRFWLSSSQIIKSISEVEYVTFAVDASYTNLVKLYEKVATDVVFRGSVPKYPDREVMIFAAPKKRFENLFWIYTPVFMERLQRSLGRKWRQIQNRPVLQTGEI
ncbi:MAG: hypothetical protein ACOH5I_18840 [Oligoflexus sp.]